MRFAVLAVLCCSTGLVACDGGDPQPEDDATRVALEAGTRWTYAHVAERYVARVGGTELDSLVFSWPDTVVVEVSRRDAVLGEVTGLIEVRGGTYRNGPFAEWYREEDGALVQVANAQYPGGGTQWVTPFAPPAPQGTGSVSRSGGDENCGETDAGLRYCFRESPRLVYEYPLEVGDTWTSFTLPEIGLTMRREVEAAGTTTTPAGTFETFAIANTWGNFDLSGTDYVAREGLIRRSVVSYDEWEQWPGGEGGEPSRFVERLELIRLERP